MPGGRRLGGPAAGGGTVRRLPGWVGSVRETDYCAEQGERGRGEQDVVEPAGRTSAGGVSQPGAEDRRDLGGYPGAGARGNGGGKPMGGVGRDGQIRQGVLGGGGDV